MKIGIDAQTILNPEVGDSTGIGHYTFQLIRHLIELDKENEYVLFFNYRVRKKDIRKFTKPNVTMRSFPYSYYKQFLPLVYSELLSSAFFQRDNLDILHVPGGRLPLSYKGKFVVTSHNLAIKKFPDMFPQKSILKYQLKPPALHRADAVIASSESARKSLREDFSVEGGKIRVVYNGFDERFSSGTTIEDIQRVKEKHGIDGEYILFMNTIKPLNNLSRLIEAFSKSRLLLKGKKPQSNYKLVIAGKSGWLADEIKQTAKDFGLKNEVVFPGYIPPEDLNALFGGADLFVFVPIFEEFGSPVLEAMASGIPVVCSNVSSLPELVNGAAAMVDPYDIEGIKDAILKIVDDDNYREDLKKKGLEQARKFSWKKTAEKTLEVYKEIALQQK